MSNYYFKRPVGFSARINVPDNFEREPVPVWHTIRSMFHPQRTIQQTCPPNIHSYHRINCVHSINGGDFLFSAYNGHHTLKWKNYLVRDEPDVFVSEAIK